MPRGRGLPIEKQSSNELRFMIVYLPMFPLTALVSSFFFTPRRPNPDWLVWNGRFLMLGGRRGARVLLQPAPLARIAEAPARALRPVR